MVEIYGAIEMARGETPHGTVHRLMQAAESQRLLFDKLEVLDVFTIGSRRFVRFKVDHPDLVQITTDIRRNRAVVLPNGTGYKVYLPEGRCANVPTAKMHLVPSSDLQRMYRGPHHKLWKAQFQDLNN